MWHALRNVLRYIFTNQRTDSWHPPSLKGFSNIFCTLYRCTMWYIGKCTLEIVMYHDSAARVIHDIRECTFPHIPQYSYCSFVLYHPLILKNFTPWTVSLHWADDFSMCMTSSTMVTNMLCSIVIFGDATNSDLSSLMENYQNGTWSSQEWCCNQWIITRMVYDSISLLYMGRYTMVYDKNWQWMVQIYMFIHAKEGN